MSILTNDESGDLSQYSKSDSCGNAQECLTVTRAKLYEAVFYRIPSQIIQAEMLSSVEFEAKVVLDISEKVTLIKGSPLD